MLKNFYICLFSRSEKGQWSERIESTRPINETAGICRIQNREIPRVNDCMKNHCFLSSMTFAINYQF